MAKSIEDLIKITTEENAKTRALNEKLASGRRENNQFASNEEIAVAKSQLKKEDELIAIQKQSLNISSDRFEEAQQLGAAIKAQESIMKVQSESLESLGITASEDETYKKEERKLAKMQLKLAKTTGSKDAEKSARDKLGERKMLTYMKGTFGFLGNIAKQGMQKVKSGLSGFTKFAFGALALAALAFLNSPKFDEYYDQIMTKIIPKLVTIYKVIVKLGKIIGGKLLKLFNDISDAIDGKEGSWTKLLDENLLTIGLIALALAPAKLFGIVLTGVGLLATGLKAAYTSAAVTAYLATPAAAVLLKAVSLGTLALGVVTAVYDGVMGWFNSDKWGVNKISGAISGFFAGGEAKGFTQTLTNMSTSALKWGAIGAGALSFFFGIGAAIGFAVGAIFGTILGYFGGEELAKKIDPIIDVMSKAIDELYSFISDNVLLFFETVKKALGFDGAKTAEEIARIKQAEENNRRREELSKRKAATEEYFRDIGKKERKLKRVTDDVNDEGAIQGGLSRFETDEERAKDRLTMENLVKEIEKMRKERTEVVANNIIADNSVKGGSTTNNNTQQMLMMTHNDPILNLLGGGA